MPNHRRPLVPRSSHKEQGAKPDYLPTAADKGCPEERHTSLIERPLSNEGTRRDLRHPNASLTPGYAHVMFTACLILRPFPHASSPLRSPGSTRATLDPNALGDCVHRVGPVPSTHFVRVAVACIVADALAVDRVVGVGRGGIRRDVAAPALGTPARSNVTIKRFSCGISRSSSKLSDVLCHQNQAEEPP